VTQLRFATLCPDSINHTNGGFIQHLRWPADFFLLITCTFAGTRILYCASLTNISPLFKLAEVNNNNTQ